MKESLPQSLSGQTTVVHDPGRGLRRVEESRRRAARMDQPGGTGEAGPIDYYI